MQDLEIVRTVEVIESGAKVRGQRDFQQMNGGFLGSMDGAKVPPSSR
jgi:hypothetical protein